MASVRFADAGIENAAVLSKAVSAVAPQAVLALARFYAAENEAVADAYLARAERSMKPAGNSEACVRPDGRISRRLSVLGNPPLSQNAIAQRTRLFAALAAVDALLIARREVPFGASTAATERTLRVQLALLTIAANRHGAGDLFIEDEVSVLSHAVTIAINTHWKGEHPDQIDSIVAAVVKLSDILSSDAESHRAVSVAAASLASGLLRRTVIPVLPADANPVCSEPAVFAVRAVRATPSQTFKSSSEGRRAARAQRRAQALAMSGPRRLISLLATIAAAAASTEANPEDDVKTAVVTFSSMAHNFISTMFAVTK